MRIRSNLIVDGQRLEAMTVNIVGQYSGDSTSTFPGEIDAKERLCSLVLGSLCLV